MNPAAGKPRVFICYMKQDNDIANQIYDYLEETGAEPWLDTRNLVLGDRWAEEI